MRSGIKTSRTAVSARQELQRLKIRRLCRRTKHALTKSHHQRALIGHISAEERDLPLCERTKLRAATWFFGVPCAALL